PGFDRDGEADAGRTAVVHSSGSSSGSGPSQLPGSSASTRRSTGTVGGGDAVAPAPRSANDEDAGDEGEAGDAACRAASIRLQISGGTGPASSARSNPRTRS